MKKTQVIFLLCAAISAHAVQAKDIAQGTVSLGGRPSYFSVGKSEFDNNSSISSYRLGATVGYFMQDNLEIGSGFFYEYTDFGGNFTSSTRKSYTVSPYITQHIPLTATSNLTLSGQIDYLGIDEGNSDRDYKFWGIAVGWEYFVNEHIAFEALLYHKQQFDRDNNNNTYEQRTAADLGLKLYF